jgi:glycosyltransferase involved in cell wall biosynthesis
MAEAPLARAGAAVATVQPVAVHAVLAATRRVAVVPAFNEAGSVAAVLEELRDVDPGMEVVVVDDGSTDGTRAAAVAAGAHVVRLPFNLGIGGAVQTGFQYALQHGFELAVRLDGDGQHDPREIARLVEPVLAGEADIAVGSRFAAGRKEHPSRARLFGIRLLARIVSLLVRQRVTDTTSGFQALNRRALALFAADYPHDYPEVEATVMVFRHRLRLVEVPVTMRERVEGSSSITTIRSAYYMVKVMLALFVGLFRRPLTPPEESS